MLPSGILLFCFGFSIISENWISLIISLFLPITAIVYRIHIEENAFSLIIGEEYDEYKSRTKKIIPFIW